MNSIASALQHNHLSAEELRACIREGGKRRVELTNRIHAIQPTFKGRSAGLERQKLLLSGDVDAIRELDAEYMDLKIEVEQLEAQLGELKVRLQRAQTKEAVEGMPGRYRSLAERLNAVSEARDQLVALLLEADEVYFEIEQARTAAIRGGAKLPLGDATLLTQVRSLQTVASLVTTRLWARHSFVEEVLGI